jgi:hypothetical protein
LVIGIPMPLTAEPLGQDPLAPRGADDASVADQPGIYGRPIWRPGCERDRRAGDSLPRRRRTGRNWCR